MHYVNLRLMLHSFLCLYMLFSNLCLCLTKGIFGQCLEDTLKYELERDPTRQVPEIVQMCVEFLYANGLEIDGLFRFV